MGRARQNAGFSQKKLAAALRWNQSYLSRIENGTRKLPSRDRIISIAQIMKLSQEDTDELLLSAQYQPFSLLEIGIGENEESLKKHMSVLRDIRDTVPLASFLRAKEEIVDFLELIRMKYLQKINETVTKRSLLADFIYAKVKNYGLQGLYEAVSRPQGGAIVIRNGKMLLAPIGISPLKGVWHIPAGFINPKKGDRSAKDIVVRLALRYLPAARIEAVKELTSEGEALETIDTTDYSIKLGFFPAPFQIFEMTVQGNLQEPSEGAAFFSFEDMAHMRDSVHPLLSEIIKPFVKNSKITEAIYKRGQETIEALVRKRNYQRDMDRFHDERIKKNAVSNISK